MDKQIERRTFLSAAAMAGLPCLPQSKAPPGPVFANLGGYRALTPEALEVLIAALSARCMASYHEWHETTDELVSGTGCATPR